MIAVRKFARSLTAAMPGWLAAFRAVCLLIPLARYYSPGL